jgi:uncharacterized LabA/DUF88 family protein
MSDQKLKIAVFIDFDNVEIGVKTTLGLPFDIGAVLEAIKERGEIVTKVAFGDWKRSGDYGRAMSNHAVRLVQRVMTPGGDKNGADINLALDALEMAFTHAHINAFVIVGGDSDFITLVEKLKQYDRKVFVVGGRAFTSQVMQKNCTEFIAYENIVPDRRAQARADRGERPRSGSTHGAQSLDGAVALVKRALQVLADREVSPQLGLLKSTLLQLDSSFSERDYGSGSFRDFADKLAQQGIVVLRHQGRTTLVELADGRPDTTEDGGVAPVTELPAETSSSDETAAQSGPEAVTSGEATLPRRVDSPSLGEGVALVRRVLAEATTPPRWPMYPRQFKQFLRAADPGFDERKYGSIADLMRACQKDGLLKLERDRQGALRVFSGAGTAARGPVPHGWATLAPASQNESADDLREETGEGPEHSMTGTPSASHDDLPDDDIGNRIVGGAIDPTRELLGTVGGDRQPLPEGDDDEIIDEPQPPELALTATRGRRTGTARKRPAARKTSARKAPARAKKTSR